MSTLTDTSNVAAWIVAVALSTVLGLSEWSLRLKR